MSEDTGRKEGGVERIVIVDLYGWHIARVKFAGLDAPVAIDPDLAQQVIDRAHADGVEVVERVGYHCFGENEYGELYLADALAEARLRSVDYEPAPRLRKIGSERVARYAVQTVWVEE